MRIAHPGPFPGRRPLFKETAGRGGITRGDLFRYLGATLHPGSSNSPPVPLVADNMPQIWFFGESLGATMVLMLYLWVMSSRFLQKRDP